MFFNKNKTRKSYDVQNKKPAIKASICNGEQVADFIDLGSGTFEDVMLIRDSSDLDEFRTTYGITGEIEKVY